MAKSVSVRLHADLHAALAAQAKAKDCTIPHLLFELLELAGIVAECRKVEVTWPSGREAPPVVRVWMPAQEAP
jgi:hypothetical protein